jgi:hypothetical protein
VALTVRELNFDEFKSGGLHEKHQATIEELLETVFSVRSMPVCYVVCAGNDAMQQ